MIVVKLVSGEMFVCKAANDRGDYYIVEKPMVLMPTQQGMALVPFGAPYSDDTFVQIDKANILCTMSPTSELESGYIQATSGLVTPPQGFKLD